MAQEAATTKVLVHDGAEYTVPVHPLEDLDALEALEDNRYSALAKAVLGAKQYAAFRATHKKTADLVELVGALLGDDEDEETDDKE